MKRALQYWFSFLLILLIGSEILVSCKAKQPLKEVTKETTDTKDLTSVKELIEINKEVTDQLIWQLSQVKTSNPECDSITRDYLYRLLNAWNTEKVSGDNSYSLKFNELLGQMELQVKLAQTINKSKDSIKTVSTTTTINHTIEKPVKMPLPWYQKVLQYVGIIALAIISLKIYSFIATRKTI